MFDEVPDNEVEDAIRLKWIMIESSKDDPLLQAQMITSLEELCTKKSIKIPYEKAKILDEHKKRIKEFLKKEIDEKRKKYDKLLEKIKPKLEKIQEEHHSRTDDIFAGTKFE